MLGPACGSAALSASGLQLGHSAGAGSQPASAWGQASHEARTQPDLTGLNRAGALPMPNSHNEHGRHGARVLV